MNEVKIKDQTKKIITIALAGQPNVGKSVLFNRMTGLSQTVGNWPGKTVSKAEGIAKFKHYTFKIIDLPGIYSLSTYSLEEIISREYILGEKPDYIINVVDSNHLERNLFLTLQLLMLNRPLILSLNQMDLLKERGYDINTGKLSELLEIPVVPCVAVHNLGIHELLEKIIDIEENNKFVKIKEILFGKEIEKEISKIESQINELEPNFSCTSKFMAVKLLENDQNCIANLYTSPNIPKEKTDKLFNDIENTQKKLEDLHGEQISTILNAEFYNISSQIVEKVELIKYQTKSNKFKNFLDHITIGNFTGYLILIFVLFGIYLTIFLLGNLISSGLDGIYNSLNPWAISTFGEDTWGYKIIWNAIIGGLNAGIGGVLPYVIPFFLLIELLQDTGYLPRAAYLMDKFMHKIGVHGKTIIPVLIGFGCNVPAISAASIMETENEKKRAIVISSLVPCSAVTTIVLGLIAKHLGIGWAFALYLINFMVIIFVGKIMIYWFDEDALQSELIIELHDFRKPNGKIILKQTWHRSKEFVVFALPLIVLLSILMQILMEYNLEGIINTILSPLTVYILGLPIGVGLYLFYGVLRKELNLVLLEIYVISIGYTMIEYMTPIQMISFTLITMLYVPCLATIIVIGKEAGKKFATQIFFLELLGAIIISSLVRWSYEIFVIIFPQKSTTLYLIYTFIFLFLTLLTSMYVIKKFPKSTDKNLREKRTNIVLEQSKGSEQADNCGNCHKCFIDLQNEKKD